MQRRFIGNLVFLQAVNWLIKPVWIFWIDRLVQVQLGDDLYGRYYVVFSFGLLFNILLDFGLNNYVAAEVGRSGNPSMVRPVIRLRLMLSALYVLLLFALGLLQNFDPAILTLAIANQVLSGFVLLYRAILQGRHLFRQDSLISVTDRFTAILICALFLYGNGFTGKTGILVFLGAQTLGYVVALAFAMWLAYRGTAGISTSGLPQNQRELLKQTGWFAVMAFAMAVFTRVDTLMLRYLASDEFAEAGRYARSYRLLDAAVIFSGLVSTMLLPIFSRMITRRESTDSLVWLNTRIVLFVSAGTAWAALFYGRDILTLLYPDLVSHNSEATAAVNIFIPVLCTFVPMSLVHVFGTWLTAADRLKMLSFFALEAVILNILLNLFLIPQFGARGAGISGLVTQSAFALACIWAAQRQQAFEIRAVRLVLLILWLGCTAAAFAVVRQYITGITGLLAACAAFLAVTIASGIFFPEIKKYFNTPGKN